MKNLRNLYIGLFAATFLASCAPKDATYEITPPTVDFSKYIAVGNSLTAGYADGGLYLEGQRVAFPNLIAEQMQKIGGGSFTSPFFSEDQANGSGYLRLTGIENGRPITAPVTDRLAIRGPNAQGNPLYTKHTGEINNYGVPGMRLDMAFAPYIGTEEGNPFFERLLPEGSSPEMTYMAFTTQNDHTFFTFWLGNNDVLGYATNGAVTNQPTEALTEVSTFTGAYQNYIDALTAQNQKGVVATIPDVTAVPYFTTITYAQLLAGVQAVNSAVEDIFIATKQGPRPATPEDLFFLTFPTDQLGQGEIPFGLHPANPISDDLVLDREEILEVQERINQFNEIIQQIASSKDLAVVDIHAFLNKVKDGYFYNGIPISSAFITGNAFSLDGIHLTPMGNAIVANLFIDAINKQYNASIPKTDVTLYPGVKMP